MQAALMIAGALHLLGQRVGAETHGPDHGAGFDATAIGEGDAACVDRGRRGADDPFDAQMFRGLDDGWTDAVAQG
ncbi:hypothetical protein FQZ97_1181960 [compost metagenome]